jgi:hypothetical protein
MQQLLVESLRYEPIGATSFEVKSEKKVLFRYRYHADKGYSENNWFDFASEEEIKSIYELIFEYQKNHNIPFANSLSDISAYDGSFDAVNLWLISQYIPKLLKEGFQRLAIVVSKEFFAHLSFEEFEAMSAQLPFEQVAFENRADAERWIVC